MRALCLLFHVKRCGYGVSRKKIPLSYGGFFCFRQDESVGFGHCACFVAWVNGKKPVFIPLGGFSSYLNRVDNTNG